eukprot:GEMP01009792.1.p1 GENE.GEMP01009792.1~~GEMP01009792.1.p1  ORF type:complete len:368 (+),score=63.46 GEMP01009792.1:128-1231(+)
MILAQSAIRRDFPPSIHSDLLINVSIEVARTLNYFLVPAEFDTIRLRQRMGIFKCLIPQAFAHRDDVLVYVEETGEYKTLVAQGGLSDIFRRSLDLRLAAVVQEFINSPYHQSEFSCPMSISLEEDSRSFKREAKAFCYFTQQLSKLDWRPRVDEWIKVDPSECMASLQHDVVQPLCESLGTAPKQDLFHLWDLAGFSVERFIFSKIAGDLWQKYKLLYREEDERYREMRRACGLVSEEQIRAHFGVEGDVMYSQATALLTDLEQHWGRNLIASRTESLEKLHLVRVALKVEALENGLNLEAMDDLCPAFCMVVYLANLQHPVALQHLLRDLMWFPEERTSSDGMVTSLLEMSVAMVCVELNKLTLE